MIKQLRYLCTLLLMAVASVAWGQEVTVTISYSDIPDGFTATTGTSGTFEISVADNDLTIAYSGINTKSKADAEDHSYGYAMFLKNYGYLYSTTAPTGYYPSKVTVKFSSSTGVSGKVGVSYGSEVISARNSSVTGTVTKDGTYELENVDQTKLYWNFSTTNANVQVNNITVVYSPINSSAVATPTFSPISGAYTEDQSVTIDCATDGATIYYTIDGTDPTTETSNVYSSPIAVSETTTIKAMAVKSEMENSGIATAVYAITEHAGTEADPYTVADAIEVIDAGVGLSGVYATGIVTAIPTAYDSGHGNITFNFVDSEGDVNFLQAYRCAGTEAANVAVGDIVVVKGNLTKYGSTYEFGQGCELVKLEKADVAVPTFTPAEGIYYGSQNVSIVCETEGASVYYTTDGTEPTTSSTLYTSAIVVDETTTIKAIAVKGNTISSIVSATYTIRDAGAQGGPNNPFSVAQAMEAETQSSVFVKGIISEIKSLDVSKYKRAQYYISDNGEKENQFLIYNGYYLNGQDFTDNNQIAVGDEVVVFGDIVLYNGSNQLAQNNYIVSLNRPETPYVLPLPTFSPAAGEVEAGTPVTINIAEDENVAYVEYSFDQATWNKYTVGETEIKITEETTIYARSVGTTPNTYSEVASATYTIKAETPAQDVVIVEEDKTTFLFNTAGNEWKIPTEKTVDEGTFSANGYSIKVAGSTGNGYSYNTSDKYLLIGKQGAYLTLPAFDFEVGKIEVVGRNGASGKVTQNIFVTVEDEEIAVSTETTGITGTQLYVIGEGYRAAGNVYTLKVTNGNNTQITQIVAYKATGEEKADPQLKFSAATATATLGSEFAAPTLSYVEGFDGTVKYESSNTEVATVDANTGVVTLVAAGETVIKATSEETGNYLAGEASYTLTVQEAPVVGSDKYELVTDASTLKVGDDVVFAFVGTLTVSSAETKVAQAMGTEFNNNSVLLAVDIVDNGDQTISTGDNVMFLTLGGEENAWTFENNGNYLASTGKKKNEDGSSPSSNQNTIELTEDGTDAHAQAHIAIAEDGEATVTFNGGNGCNLLQYNVNSGKNQRFSCYSAKMSGLQLYRKVTSTETVKGDVNKDGDVTIADVTALVNIILGKDNTEPYQYDHVAANVNGDEGISIADVTALVNIILGKTN